MDREEERLVDLLFSRIASRESLLKEEELESAREAQGRYREAGVHVPLAELALQAGHLSREKAGKISRALQKRIASDRDALFRKLALRNGYVQPKDIRRAEEIRAGQGTKQPLGLILLDLGALQPEQHRAVINAQKRVLKARYSGRGGEGKEAGGPSEEERYFENYRILDEITRGGMGIIYKAYHPGLEKEVALKTLLEGEAASREQIERFHLEAKAAARLRHPNIVAVHDVGISEGVHYFTMDYIEGMDMDDLIEEGALSMMWAVEILAKVSHALHFAHGNGIIHRDIKPANILLDEEGEPYVTDFGLAKDVASHKKLSMEGMAIGTPEFMSPEQAKGNKRIDPRTDVYSVGAVLYKTLCGRPPFTGKTPLDILGKIITADPRPPRQFRPGIPKGLETVCLKCLEKDPARRYATAEDLALDLERYQAGEPVRARPPSLPALVVRRVKKHRFLALAIVAILAAVVVTAVVVSTRAQEESELITAQLERLQARVTSLKKQDREDRSGLVKEIEQVLRTGTAKEKEQARELLRTLGRGAGSGGRPLPEDEAARRLEEAEKFIAAHPPAFDEALARLRGIASLFPDTPAGRKAISRAEEVRASRSGRLGERFAETASRADRLLAEGKPGAAARAWRELLPELASEPLALEAVSQMEGIVLRQLRNYFDAWTEAEGFASRGDTASASDLIKPFASSDLKDVKRWAGLSITRFKELEARIKKVEEGPESVERFAEAEREAARRTAEFVDRLASRVREYDIPAVRRLWDERLSEAQGPAVAGGLWDRFADFQAVEKLWHAFRLALFEGKGRTVELLVKGTGEGAPVRRKVELLGVGKKDLRVRMMNAETTIPLLKVHPLSVVELGTGVLGKGKPEAFASGVFLYCCGLYKEAGSRLASLEEAFPSAAWYQGRIGEAETRALEGEARGEFEAMETLARKAKWRELRKALEAFRARFEACAFFQGYAGGLSRLEGQCSPIVVRSFEVFPDACSHGEDGGIRLTYSFARAKELDDWVWAPVYDAYAMGSMVRERKEIRMQGASLRHLCRFDGSDFSGKFHLSIPEPSGVWGMKVFNLFVKIFEGKETTVQLCRGEFESAPFYTTAVPGPEGEAVTLKIERRESELRLYLRGKAVYTGRIGEGYPWEGFALFAGHDTELRVRGVEINGTPCMESLVQIEEARRAKKKAERLFRAASPTVLVTPTKVTGWDPEDLKKWSHGKGELSVLALDREVDLESVLSFEDVLLEAMVRASGRGEASIDLHDNSGEEREIIVPTGEPGAWFKLEFALYGGFGWGTINGIPAAVDAPFDSILPGLIELDVEPGSGMHIRSLRVRALKRRGRPEGWVRLFNGKDLAGWVVKGAGEAWEVHDGAIRARRTKPGVNRLRSVDYWRNFELKLAVKVEKDSKARIFFRWDRTAIFVESFPTDGEWHQVFISVRGEKAKAILDGAPLGFGHSGRGDHNPELGNFGLVVSKGTVWFRDIAVKALR